MKYLCPFFCLFIFQLTLVNTNSKRDGNIRESRNVKKPKYGPTTAKTTTKKYEEAVNEYYIAETFSPSKNVKYEDKASNYSPTFQPKFQNPQCSALIYNFYSKPNCRKFNPYNHNSQYNNYNSYSYTDVITYEQWCTDACAIRGAGGYKKVNLNKSPKSYQYPSNNGLLQDLDDMNCHCLCPVPLSQDPDYRLCNNQGESHHTCENFCFGFLDIKPVNIVGSIASYFGGSCIEGSGCNCLCRAYHIPLQ